MFMYSYVKKLGEEKMLISRKVFFRSVLPKHTHIEEDRTGFGEMVSELWRAVLFVSFFLLFFFLFEAIPDCQSSSSLNI